MTITATDRTQIEQEVDRMFHQLGDKAGRTLDSPEARLKYQQWLSRTLGEIRRLQELLVTEEEPCP